MSDEQLIEEEKIEMERIELGHTWSWPKFLRGVAGMLTSKYFVAFMVITYFVNKFLHNGQSDEIKFALVVLWGVVAVVWLLSEAWLKFIEHGKLNVDVASKIELKKEGKNGQ